MFSYFGEYKLSPFAGGLGRYYVVGVKTNKEYGGAGGAGVPDTEIEINGKTYLVKNYKKYLNDTVNKGGKLVSSIESTLKSLGLPPIKEICPEFFDANGRIEVYSNLSLEQASKNEVYENTVNLIKSGARSESPMIKKISQTITVTRNIASDAVTLVAFSPVSGTVFNITTSCTPPKA